ncbi:hypothetical protein CON64_19300 [Bacillus pseudomycoides]|nr:hypothetical protein CON64_19300 [Bacillus pseudomycoides]
MHRSSQGLFLPHAKFKQKEKESSRLLLFLHSSNLSVKKSKWMYIERVQIHFCTLLLITSMENLYILVSLQYTT